MLKFSLIRYALLVCALSLPAHAHASSSDDSLYQALGQQQGISALMETFILEIAEDQRIIHHFENTDIERLHRMLTEQICELSGGPCTYSGDDMVTVHTGMKVTGAEFNALVEDLISAMEQHDIAVSAQNRLLAILAAMHKEVVNL